MWKLHVSLTFWVKKCIIEVKNITWQRGVGGCVYHVLLPQSQLGTSEPGSTGGFFALKGSFYSHCCQSAADFIFLHLCEFPAPLLAG